jgi:hypothetical protein
MDCGPIFIGGLSRCGKTLIGSLLSAHPNIAIPRKELNLWTKYYRMYGDLNQLKNIDRCLAAMLHYKSIVRLNPNIDSIRNEFCQGQKSYSRLFDLFLTHYSERIGKRRWGIHSVCIDYYTDFIFSAFPTAKMIYTIRDPRDRYAEQITTRRARLGGKVAIASFNWLYSLSLAEKKQVQYPQRYQIIRYETLVAEPQKTIQSICKFLNEDFSPLESVMQDFSSYKGKEISTAFIGGYRKRMSKLEIAFMQANTKPQMLTYKYKTETISFSIYDTLLYHFGFQPFNFIVIVFWRFLKFIYRRFPVPMKYFGKSPIMYPTR